MAYDDLIRPPQSALQFSLAAAMSSGASFRPMETIENSITTRAKVELHPKQLSKVTNGKALFVEADGRGPWARRWRDLLAQIISDLGGADLLSEGQRQLARRCATIALSCERMEGEAALGKEIDLDTYGALTDRLGRTLQRLGLKRVARDTGLTLSDLLRADLEQQRVQS
jgi:hypothetical protein